MRFRHEGIGDVLPCQVEVATTLPGLLGWRRLACAVLEDACRCAGLIDQQPVPDGGRQLRRDFWRKRVMRDAVEWLLGECPDVAFPIDVACALAGVNPQALRERLTRSLRLLGLTPASLVLLKREERPHVCRGRGHARCGRRFR